MNQFIWKFPYERLRSSNLFADEYICIAAEMRVDPVDLLQNRIWMITDLDPAGSFLYGTLKVASVSVIQEGLNKGHFVIAADHLLSFRIFPWEKEDLRAWKVDNLSTVIGVSGCSDELRKSFIDLIKKNDVRVFSQPPSAKLSLIEIPTEVSSQYAASREIYRSILSRFPLGELHRYVPLKELSPFGALATEKCRELGLGDEVESEISSLDIILMSSVEELLITADPNIPNPTPPLVDTSLTCIRPEEVVSRRFLKTVIDNKNKTLTKTQMAETRHQDILREISKYLISIRLHPLQSRSVDLAVRSRSGLVLGEIKSSTSDNFINQIDQGIIQLIKYELAFEEEGYSIASKAIVIESPTENAILNYARKISQKCDTKVLSYDGKAEWPERIPGLLKIFC